MDTRETVLASLRGPLAAATLEEVVEGTGLNYSAAYNTLMELAREGAVTISERRRPSPAGLVFTLGQGPPAETREEMKARYSRRLALAAEGFNRAARECRAIGFEPHVCLHFHADSGPLPLVDASLYPHS